MFGDPARDQAAPPLDPIGKFGAGQLYGLNQAVPWVAVSQDLEPAPSPSVLDIDNKNTIIVQQQLAKQTNQTSLHSKMVSLNSRLAWAPQTTKGTS